MANFLGLDFLFSRKEYNQSVTTDSTGTRVLVNSSLKGEILAVRPVPPQFLEKPWFTDKVRYPRDYLGIPKIDERVSTLSYLVHVLTTYGLPNRRFLKDALRLSVYWWKTSYEIMRKHVNRLTREVLGSEGRRLATRMCRKERLTSYPRKCGVNNHANGISVPIYRKVPRNRENSAREGRTGDYA